MKAEINFIFLPGQVWPRSFIGEPTIDVDMTDVDHLTSGELDALRTYRSKQAQYTVYKWLNRAKFSATVVDGEVTLKYIEPAEENAEPEKKKENNDKLNHAEESTN